MAFELSCDLGEAGTAEEERIEEQIWPLIDFANVACGGHAGDERSMQRAVEIAASRGVRLGAHPSYPDRGGFGRRSIAIEDGDLRETLKEQIGTLFRAAGEGGLRVERVKPHGALYNDAVRDPARAGVVVETLAEIGELGLVAPERSAMAELAREHGVPLVREAFVDRRYGPDGKILPRHHPEALLLDVEAAVAQTRLLVEESSVRTLEGRTMRISYETLCAHGDMPGSVDRIRSVRKLLDSCG